MSRIYAFKCDHCGELRQSLSSMVQVGDFHYCEKPECRKRASRCHDISMQLQKANYNGLGSVLR